MECPHAQGLRIVFIAQILPQFEILGEFKVLVCTGLPVCKESARICPESLLTCSRRTSFSLSKIEVLESATRSRLASRSANSLMILSLIFVSILVAPALICASETPHHVPGTFLARQAVLEHRSLLRRDAHCPYPMLVECARPTEDLVALSAMCGFLPIPPGRTTSAAVNQPALSRRGTRLHGCLNVFCHFVFLS